MPNFQLLVRKPDGVTFQGTAYTKGQVVTTTTDLLLLEALGEVGDFCDIFRLTAPGGQVFKDLALSETRLKIAPLATAFGSIQTDYFVAPLAAAATAIKTSIATVIGTVIYTGAAAINGSIGLARMFPSRNITVTVGGGTATDAPNSCTVTGLGPDGLAQTETFVVTRSAGTYAGIKPFMSVTQVQFDNGIGVGATLTVGFGVVMGLTNLPKLRDSKVNIISELLNGAVPATAGTLVSAATAPPFGTYSPNTAANGTNNYVVQYEGP